MITEYNKAIVAVIGAMLYFLQLWLKIDFSWVTEEMIQNAIPVVTPFFVWLVPNKPKPAV